MNYSQLGQDLEVLKFYNNKKNGFFIEIGAYDGVELSNKFELLCKNRPNSLCYDYAVYNESYTDIKFDIGNNCEMLSGISGKLDCDCYINLVNADKTQIMRTTISLNDLLEKSNSPLFIDYLSLDTEGSELEILKSVDFSKYTFGLIDVEHNGVEPKRTQIKDLLTSNGYIYIRENNWDDCYKHQSV
jgi:hypothetical protein